MAQTIKPDDLSIELSSILDGYSVQVSETVSAAVIKAGKNALKNVRVKSPKRTGKYAKGWRLKQEKTGVGGRNTSVAVYNKDRYMLTHLLENGYQKASGGREEGQPHIRPAYEQVERTLEGEVRRAIEEADYDL